MLAGCDGARSAATQREGQDAAVWRLWQLRVERRGGGRAGEQAQGVLQPGSKRITTIMQSTGRL